MDVVGVVVVDVVGVDVVTLPYFLFSMKLCREVGRGGEGGTNEYACTDCVLSAFVFQVGG